MIFVKWLGNNSDFIHHSNLNIFFNADIRIFYQLQFNYLVAFFEHEASDQIIGQICLFIHLYIVNILSIYLFNVLIQTYILIVMQQGDIIFIRHAQSQVNNATVAIAKKYNIPNTYLSLKDYPEWVDGVKYSIKFLDCSISQLGKDQCLKARKKADQLKPDIILVSPMERALQTCNLLFGHRGIPIIVQPILTQSIRSASDICGQIKPKTERFPHINFQNVLNQQDIWNFLMDQEHKDAYLQKINQSGATNLNQKIQAAIAYMSSNSIYETSKNVRNRVKKIKQLLKKYKQKYDQIVVVAHFNTINFTVTKQFNQEDQPKNSMKIHNCQFHSENLQEILKYS